MAENNYKRSHKINIIENTYKYYLLLLIPAIRGLFLYGQGFYEWFRGVWFDMLVLFLIFLIGYANWFFYTFKIKKDGVYISRGVFVWKNTFIPFENISAVFVVYPFLWRIIGAVKVRMDTNAGSHKKFDITITMRKKDAAALLKIIDARTNAKVDIKKIFTPKIFNIAMLSLITSNSLTGIIFLSALISQGGKILGREFEEFVYNSLTDVVKKYAFGIPPVAAVIVYIILGGWIIAFLRQVFRYKNFTVMRKENILKISGGILMKREYSIDVGKINYLQINQSILTKFFNIFSVFVCIAGYGKDKNSINILVPAVSKRELDLNLKILLPEITAGKINYKPKKDALVGFVLIPVVLVLIIGITGIFLHSIFPEFSASILFILIMTEIPFLWLLILRIIAFPNMGIGFDGSIYTFNYTRGFNIKTIAAPADRVVKIVVKQNPLQKVSKRCTIIIYTYFERTNKHKIRSINYADAVNLFEIPE